MQAICGTHFSLMLKYFLTTLLDTASHVSNGIRPCTQNLNPSPPEPLLAGTNTSGIQNRLGVLFFMLLYLSLMALTSLPIWRDEKLLFLRERDSGAYGTPAYFAAVVLFDLLPMRIIPPTFFALFSYWMIGLHQSSAVCLLWFIGALGSVVKALGCSE